MSTKFNMIRDVSGYNGFGIIPTYDIQGCYLTESEAQTFTVPDNYANWIAIFSFTPGANIFVDFVTTATVPGDTVGSVSVVLNPSARAVKGGSTFSVITPDSDTPYITVEYQIVAPYQN